MPDLAYLVKIILLSACREFDGKDQRREKAGGKGMEERKGKPTMGSFLYRNNLHFRSVTFSYFLICFSICSKVNDAKKNPFICYASIVTVSNQSIEEKANKISFMLIFRDKPYQTTESCGKKRNRSFTKRYIARYMLRTQYFWSYCNTFFSNRTIRTVGWLSSVFQVLIGFMSLSFLHKYTYAHT